MDSDDLDPDPLEVESWEEYCKLCIRMGMLDIFKNKLSNFIYKTNEVARKSLQEYAVRRLGEIAHDELSKQFKNKKVS